MNFSTNRSELPSCATLMGSCPTRVFLPNSDAAGERDRAVYEAASLPLAAGGRYDVRFIDPFARAARLERSYEWAPAGERTRKRARQRSRKGTRLEVERQ